MLKPKPSGVSLLVDLVMISVAFKDPGWLSLRDVLFFVGLAALITLESRLFGVYVTSPRAAERQR